MTSSAPFRLPQAICALILGQLRQEFENLPARAPWGRTIGGEDNPYLRRWFVTPRGDGPSCYLHQFLRDDDDRALHDHPWASVGIILKGGYIEHTLEGTFERRVGDVLPRTPEHAHRVALHRDRDGRVVEAWTLFLVGDRVREWGFHCDGWIHWRDFTAGADGEVIGAGCEGPASVPGTALRIDGRF